MRAPCPVEQLLVDDTVHDSKGLGSADVPVIVGPAPHQRIEFGDQPFCRLPDHAFDAVVGLIDQHLHCLVPGAGLGERGRFVRVKQPDFLVHRPHLQSAFRQHLRELFHAHGWQVDPTVWGKDWGVHIQPAGNGASALKYLGAYVARTAISDARILQVTEGTVTFRWKNREARRSETLTLEGVEFVRRYLRHVLPPGLRSIRYYGFCHPAARAKRLRVQLHSGRPVQMGALPVSPAPASPPPPCPCCHQPMRLIWTFLAPYRRRGPPRATASSSFSLSA
jgi:hypothetical protein